MVPTGINSFVVNSMEKKQIKIGFIAFLVVLIACLVALKPYLPRAFYYNFARLYDYKHFSNRVVLARLPGTPWPVALHSLHDPNRETVELFKKLDTTALLVLENGQIVYEKYFLDGGSDVLTGAFSMTKSVLGLLVGIALQEGKIKSLNEPISNYINEWQGRDEGKITIKHLLTMTSGLNWNENAINPFSTNAEAYYGENLYQTTLMQRLTEAPGSHYEYLSGAAQLLGLALTRAVNQSLSGYLSQKLWVPLGAEQSALWSLDHADGMEKAFCCLNARARDFARIGELVRLHGKWGEQYLLNENYIKEMTSPHFVLDRDDMRTDYYGYQWWVYPNPGGDLPYARGFLGQYIVVVPQKNRVAIRLGKKSGKAMGHRPEELRALVNWVLSQ